MRESENSAVLVQAWLKNVETTSCEILVRAPTRDITFAELDR